MRQRFGVLFLVVVSCALLGSDVIDRIAAVVNDEVILLSELDEKQFVLQAQGQLKAVDSTQVSQARREILDQLIEEKLVVQRAKSLGIELDPTEVTTRVNEAMEKVRSRFPTVDAFRETLRQEGITETMLRERYESDIRQEILGQRIVGREVRSKVEVTSDDVRKYYDEQKDDLPQKPMEINLAHIVAYPVSREREEAAGKRIAEARARIAGGEAFEDVAADASDDPSKSRGGSLGWFSPGDLDPAFESAIDTLEIEELSEPVRSRFGYHLIEVMQRDGDRFNVRHVLAMVEPSDEDVRKARERAEAARARILAGEPFEEVAGELSEDALSRDKGGDLGWTPTRYLLPQVSAVLDSLEVGAVSPVVESDLGFHVFKILNRRSGGEYAYDEIKDRLRSFLEQKELEKVYDEWLAAVRDSAYVEIKAWER